MASWFLTDGKCSTDCSMANQSDIVSMHMHTVHTHTQTHTAVGEDVTTYSSLIGEVHEVHDDSSDFELPETVVA